MYTQYYIEEIVFWWSRDIVVIINGRGYSYYQDFGIILKAISNADYMRSFGNDEVGTITQIYLDKVTDIF